MLIAASTMSLLFILLTLVASTVLGSSAGSVRHHRPATLFRRAGPLPVNLGTAINYVILAEAGISTVPVSDIVGNIAVTPIGSIALTGFSQTDDPSGTFSTSTQVMGHIFAATYNPPTPTTLGVALADMHAAYNDAAGRTPPTATELGAGQIGGLTLIPGIYKWSTVVTIDSNLFLTGACEDAYIFQIAGDLTMAADVSVILSGGLQASQIFWQVAGAVTLGSNSNFKGIILGKTGVTLQTSAIIQGRIYAQTAVALQLATVVQPPVFDPTSCVSSTTSSSMTSTTSTTTTTTTTMSTTTTTSSSSTTTMSTTTTTSSSSTTTSTLTSTTSTTPTMSTTATTSPSSTTTSTLTSSTTSTTPTTSATTTSTARRRTSTLSHTTSHKTSHTNSHITSPTTSRTASRTTHTTSRKTSHTTSHTTSHKTSHKTSRTTSHTHTTPHATSRTASHKTSHGTSHKTTHTTPRKTSHTTSHTASRTTSHKTSRKTSRKTSHATSRKTSHKTSHTTSHKERTTVFSTLTCNTHVKPVTVTVTVTDSICQSTSSLMSRHTSKKPHTSHTSKEMPTYRPPTPVASSSSLSACIASVTSSIYSACSASASASALQVCTVPTGLVSAQPPDATESMSAAFSLKTVGMAGLSVFVSFVVLLQVV